VLHGSFQSVKGNPSLLCGLVRRPEVLLPSSVGSQPLIRSRSGNIVRYGLYRTRSGKRRRYRMDFRGVPLIVTDGFDFYERVARRVFGPACLHGQILETRRNDRIVKVERRARVGAAWRFEEALNSSEGSSTLNTSFIERLNLTIHSSRVGFIAPAVAMPRAREGDARVPPGVAERLLQLRPTASRSLPALKREYR